MKKRNQSGEVVSGLVITIFVVLTIFGVVKKDVEKEKQKTVDVRQINITESHK